MTDEHKRKIENIKELAMKAFGHVEGITMEDALATLVLCNNHHAEERNMFMAVNAHQAALLSKSYYTADKAEEKALELITNLAGKPTDPCIMGGIDE